ncbi:MAG: flagellar motor protein MotA [FCB group bacterium]|nr:flagellar motor protein MotA [FCB group bacterium]
MDIATVFGLIIGLGLILFGMFDPNTQMIPSTFINIQGVAIVLGGTLAATAINYPLPNVLRMFRVAGKAFGGKNDDSAVKIINQLVELSQIARKKGFVTIEKLLPKIENNFLRMGLENAILEKDAGKLRSFLENELDNMIKRHQSGQEMFYNMGNYAPAFGLLGTVMGLILMMTQQGQSSSVAGYASQMENSMGQLLDGMGIALVTTFYGVLLANLIFIPIAGKLKGRTAFETHVNEIILAGILSIHSKEHPVIMEEKLLTFLDKDTRALHRESNGR